MDAGKSFSRPRDASQCVNAWDRTLTRIHPHLTNRNRAAMNGGSLTNSRLVSGDGQSKDSQSKGPGIAMNTRFLIGNMPAHFRCLLVPVLSLALLFCTGTRATMAAQSWRIDETHTWIGFKIEAVGFPTTKGHFTHYRGRILIRLRAPDEELHKLHCQFCFG